MSPAVVLAILVATQNVDDPATEALRATAAEALGSEDAVVVRGVEVPSDGEALRIERSVRSQAVAQVVWLDAPHTRARLRVHATETGRWIERTIVFSTVDTILERGRALGFAVTSMLPEETLAANPHRRPERPPPAFSRTAEGDYGTSLRLGVVGSLGLGGDATGGGIGIAGEFYLTSVWLLRLSFAGLVGPLPALSFKDMVTGSDRFGYAGLGLGYWPMRRSPGNRTLSVGARVDALVLYHGIEGPVSTGSVVVHPRQATFVPGLDVFGEVSWSLSDAVEIVAGLGLQVAAGRITLLLDNASAGEIPILRGTTELGIRLYF
jgi:hypothetical protein